MKITVDCEMSISLNIDGTMRLAEDALDWDKETEQVFAFRIFGVSPRFEITLLKWHKIETLGGCTYDINCWHLGESTWRSPVIPKKILRYLKKTINEKDKNES